MNYEIMSINNILIQLSIIVTMSFGGMHLNSCAPASSEMTDVHGHEEAGEHGEHHEGGNGHEDALDDHIVKLSKEQIANIDVKFEAMEVRNMRSTVKLTGRVELPPSGKALASSSLSGKVINVHVIAGQSVRKGQKLFTIENLQMVDWQQELKMKETELEFLHKELERQKALLDDEIAPTKNYEAIQAKKAQLEHGILGLKTKLKTIGISDTEEMQSSFSVRAPTSGILQHLLVSNGQYIDASMPLAELTNSDHLHLHLLAFGTDISSLGKDQTLNFFVQSRPEEIMQAKIMWINSLVDEEDNSYDIHAEIVGEDRGLSAGEYVEARIIDHEQSANAIPTKAVSIDKGLHFIFVKIREMGNMVEFRKTQIKVGESDLGYTEIFPIDPLPEVGHIRIVTEGAFFLMAESKKGEESAGGHSH